MSRQVQNTGAVRASGGFVASCYKPEGGRSELSLGLEYVLVGRQRQRILFSRSVSFDWSFVRDADARPKTYSNVFADW